MTDPRPMKTFSMIPLAIAALVSLVSCTGNAQPSESQDYAIVLHGGAGSMNFENLPEQRQLMYRAALDTALETGLAILESGGSCLDAVESVIRYMEDNPLFNAGRGAVFTAQEKNELDASIMLGNSLEAGAVAGVTDIRHPISAARAVMEQSPHVLLAGQGASEFAAGQGLEIVDASFFHTDRRFRSLMKAKAATGNGTVGCVALDRNGDLCAGTSTGGMTNKRFGRIGDSPIIGAGTYANNLTCGVSGTGHGEFFIRWTVAHDISALMEYRGLDVEQAAREVVLDKLKTAGGSGGVVCLDRQGRPAMVTNTSGMFRAYGNADGQRTVAIFATEIP